MTRDPAPANPVPPNRDLRRLARLVRRLTRFSGRRLDARVCDLIDQKGFGLAMLLRGLGRLPGPVQHRAAERIEDFLFFHPRRGRKLMGRLVAALAAVEPHTRPHLVSAIADVAGKARDYSGLPADVGAAATEVLASDADLTRKGRAAEILGNVGSVADIQSILNVMVVALKNIEAYPGFSYVETALFALKRLGGDSFLRLLINSRSTPAMAQFRLEWREHREEEIRTALAAVAALSEDTSEALLKVVELSEYNLPFLSMIQEGLSHDNKWIRQSAAASMGRLTGDTGLESLLRMLGDQAPEVRLMAVQSLGSFPMRRTGERLHVLAVSEAEVPEIRMNALYALYNQKNLNALENLTGCASPLVAMNALGLAALLMPREDGLRRLLEAFRASPMPGLAHLFHYLLELGRAEDLGLVLSYQQGMDDPARREVYLDFLARFLASKEGPGLEKALAALGPGERSAVSGLRSRAGADVPPASSVPH